MKLPMRPRAFVGSVHICLLLGVAMMGADLASAQTSNAPATNAPGPAAGLPAHLRFPQNPDIFPGKGPISTWTNFPPIWDERRAEFWRRREQDRGAVVFLGDSITQGWNSLAQDFPGLKVANRGIGADSTRGVLFRLREDVLDLHPAAVVLLIGTNDLGNGGNPEDAAENIRMILAALKQADPRMPVIVCKVMPSKEFVAAKIQALNARVDEIVKADPLWIRCDTWSIYAQADGTCKREEFPDLLHPNKLGYVKWADALRPITAKLELADGKAQ